MAEIVLRLDQLLDEAVIGEEDFFAVRITPDQIQQSRLIFHFF